jgi:PKD repeat protein
LNLNPITACTWDFGDGTTEACDLPATAAGVDATDDVEVTTTHVYTQPGVYIVIVSASNNAGTAMAAQQLVIQVPTAEEPTEQPNQLLDLFFPYVNRE